LLSQPMWKHVVQEAQRTLSEVRDAT
jgi:hypothetical protein